MLWKQGRGCDCKTTCYRDLDVWLTGPIHLLSRIRNREEVIQEDLCRMLVLRVRIPLASLGDSQVLWEFYYQKKRCQPELTVTERVKWRKNDSQDSYGPRAQRKQDCNPEGPEHRAPSHWLHSTLYLLELVFMGWESPLDQCPLYFFHFPFRMGMFIPCHCISEAGNLLSHFTVLWMESNFGP